MKTNVNFHLVIEVKTREDGVFEARSNDFPGLRGEGDSDDAAAADLAGKVRDFAVRATGASSGKLGSLIKVRERARHRN